jgi:hypothetical protein
VDAAKLLDLVMARWQPRMPAHLTAGERARFLRRHRQALLGELRPLLAGTREVRRRAASAVLGSADRATLEAFIFSHPDLYGRFDARRFLASGYDLDAMKAVVGAWVSEGEPTLDPQTRPRAKSSTLLERFGVRAAPPVRVTPERIKAEERAKEVFSLLAELLPARDGAVDPDALAAVQFALEDLGSVPVRHESTEPESWGRRDADWYDEADAHYDREFIRPCELPGLLGVDWSPETVGDLVAAFAEESERFGGTVPDWLFWQQIADTIHPDPRYGRLALQVVPKATAFTFVKEHHSALGGKAKLPPGIQYALGAVRREAFRRPKLVAVALAGHPTGRWTGRPGLPCGPREILELHRVASLGNLVTTNRRGMRVPLNAASMLTSRIMDLLPESARTEHHGCLLVTYSLTSERGTTYLSLVAKGLRPVARVRGKEAAGARAGGLGTALNSEDKIRWEYGPGAAAPAWGILRGLVDDDRIVGAQAAFSAYERQQAQAATPASGERSEER